MIWLLEDKRKNSNILQKGSRRRNNIRFSNLFANGVNVFQEVQLIK